LKKAEKVEPKKPEAESAKKDEVKKESTDS